MLAQIHPPTARRLVRLLGFRAKHSQEDDSVEHEGFVEKEDDTLEAAYRLLERRYRTLKYVVSTIAILSTIVVLLLAALHVQRYPLRHESNHFVPNLPWSTTIFERDDLFANPSSPESDNAWGSMMPPGDGFILIKDREKYDLPPGKSDRHGDVYDTSLFHQLHCLRHIRTFLYTMKAAIDKNATATVWDAVLEPQEDHVSHCFDYLRQGLMCNGDLTLEWPRTEPDGRRFAVDGWGVEHQCRSWESIVSFMKENSVMPWS